MATKNTETKVSKYAGASKAKPQQSGQNVRNGHYLFLIQGAEEGVAFKKGDYIAVRFKNIHTFEDSTPGFDYNRKIEIPVHAVGEECSDVLMMSNVSFEGRVKALAMVAGDLTQADFDAESYEGEIIDDMVGEDQPIAGVVIEVRADTVIKKDAKSKRQEELTNNDIYTRISILRRVRYADLAEIVDGSVLARAIPDLDDKIAEESEAEAA